MLKQITLQVEDAIADAYQNATPEHHHALKAIVILYLRSISTLSPLQTVVREIRTDAQPAIKRRFPVSEMVGKAKTIGDIVSPIVDEEESNCFP